MTRIRLTTGAPDGTGGPPLEVEAFYVPGTEDLFAVHAEEVAAPSQEDPEASETWWSLTHVPTGYQAAFCPLRRTAVYIGQQIFQACPGPLRLADVDALKSAVPELVVQWTGMVRVYGNYGLPVELLKSCADFVRDNS
jgi:hypothetical protein